MHKKELKQIQATDQLLYNQVGIKNAWFFNMYY